MAIHHQTRAEDPPVSSRRRVDGPVAWQVAASTFLATFTVFGVAYSFGAFFGPMADEFGSDRGATALFFSITTFLYFGLGVISGHVADRRGPRPVLLFGAVFLVLGLLATSQVSSIWLGYVTYGIGVGIGVACAYVPMVAAVGGWFDEKRTTALGIGVAGIGVGTLTVAPLAEWLIEENGWRRSYMILAVGSAVLLALAAFGAHKPPQSQTQVDQAPPLSDALRTVDFKVLYLGMLLVSAALFVPFVFLADYLDTEGITGPAGWLIGLIGISSVIGRLGLGALAARFSTMRMYRGSFVVLALSFLIWLFADNSYPALLVFAVIFGVAYGGFIALSPAVTAERFGPVGLGAVLGALYTAAGVGGLFGPPLMGWLIDSFGYPSALVVAMLFGLASAAVLLGLRPSTAPTATTHDRGANVAEPVPAEEPFDATAYEPPPLARPRDPIPVTEPTSAVRRKPEVDLLIVDEPVLPTAEPAFATSPVAPAPDPGLDGHADLDSHAGPDSHAGLRAQPAQEPASVQPGSKPWPKIAAVATVVGAAAIGLMAKKRRAQARVEDLLG